MTDFSCTFRLWQDGLTKGLYLAGIQSKPDALPPDGWVKWTLPAFEYLCVKSASSDFFPEAFAAFLADGNNLAGAVQEFYEPSEDGQLYLLFPVRRL